ncbi:MAG: L-threonylcarbamoyladenylate synthase [Bacteroidota bacterium]|nr:L-threonylcarbamoyladenylate synthase [Bacteroidota bacterium]
MLIRTFDDNLSERHLQTIVKALEQEEIIILPTDTLYAFVCDINSRKAAQNLAQLKGKVLQKSNFSLLCESLSQATNYIKPLSKHQFSFIKHLSTGGFTFVLTASNFTPKIFISKKKTIGIRITESNICKSIIREMNRPLLVTSVPHSEDMEQEDFMNIELLHDNYEGRINIVVEGESCKNIPSTVVNMLQEEYVIERQGLGIIDE